MNNYKLNTLLMFKENVKCFVFGTCISKTILEHFYYSYTVFKLKKHLIFTSINVLYIFAKSS